MRDINGDHISMLENIQDVIIKIVSEKYNLPKQKLRIFVHYLPTFFHFHIHVNAITNSQGWDAGRCHMLDTIISNIKLNHNYYQLCTLTYQIPVNSFFTRYIENNSNNS